MQYFRQLAVLVLFSTFPLSSHAEWREFEIGWTDIVPCSKTTMDETGLGFQFPTLRTAPQQLHLYVGMELPAEGTVIAAAKECVVVAAGACAVGTYLTSGAACWPAFVSTFKACADLRLGVAATKAVSTLSPRTMTECKW